MNSYDEHLRRHREAVAAQQAAHTTAEARRLIALEEGCREGHAIIRDTIAPELAKLQAAIERGGHKAKVTTTRQLSPCDPGAEFDVAVALVGDGEPPARLCYTAVPAGRYFVVSLAVGAAPAHREDVHFSHVTPAQVQDACTAFLARVFPA